MTFISDKAENFFFGGGGIQNFCLQEENWLFYNLLWPICKSSEK